jgi:hypothetical protein
VHRVYSSSPRWEVHRGLQRRGDFLFSCSLRRWHAPLRLAPAFFWTKSPQAPEVLHTAQRIWISGRLLEGCADASVRRPGAADEVATLCTPPAVLGRAKGGSCSRTLAAAAASAARRTIWGLQAGGRGAWHEHASQGAVGAACQARGAQANPDLARVEFVRVGGPPVAIGLAPARLAAFAAAAGLARGNTNQRRAHGARRAAAGRG